MSLQIIVQTTDLSHMMHAGGDVERSCRVFHVDAPELEAFLREHRDAVEKAKTTHNHPWFQRNVISVEPNQP